MITNSNSLIHILLLSNSHNDVASIQKNRGDKSHRVIVALTDRKLEMTSEGRILAEISVKTWEIFHKFLENLQTVFFTLDYIPFDNF